MFSCWTQYPSEVESKTVKAMLHLANYRADRVRMLLVMMYGISNKELFGSWKPFSVMLEFIDAQVVTPGRELLALSTEGCNQLFAKMLGGYLLKYAAASWLFMAYCASKKNVTVQDMESFFQLYQEEKKRLPSRFRYDPGLSRREYSLDVVYRDLQQLGLVQQDCVPGLATIRCVTEHPLFNQLAVVILQSRFGKNVLLAVGRQELSQAQNSVALCGPRSRILKTPPQSPTAPAVTQQLSSLTLAH